MIRGEEVEVGEVDNVNKIFLRHAYNSSERVLNVKRKRIYDVLV